MYVVLFAFQLYWTETENVIMSGSDSTISMGVFVLLLTDVLTYGAYCVLCDVSWRI